MRAYVRVDACIYVFLNLFWVFCLPFSISLFVCLCLSVCPSAVIRQTKRLTARNIAKLVSSIQDTRLSQVSRRRQILSNEVQACDCRATVPGARHWTRLLKASPQFVLLHKVGCGCCTRPVMLRTWLPLAISLDRQHSRLARALQSMLAGWSPGWLLTSRPRLMRVGAWCCPSSSLLLRHRQTLAWHGRIFSFGSHFCLELVASYCHAWLVTWRRCLLSRWLSLVMTAWLDCSNVVTCSKLFLFAFFLPKPITYSLLTIGDW